MNLKELEVKFKKNTFNNEDDIKIHFHSDIVKPLLEEFNPEMAGQYHSEDVLKAGGITDATFQNILFEFKKEGYFDRVSGVNEALYGRDRTDHGLHDYILSNAGINVNDEPDIIAKKILSGIGVGFDGKKFIFARFVPATQKKVIDTSKVKIEINEPLNIEFINEIKDFQKGIKRLALLLKQTDKVSLSKQMLCAVINPKSDYVRNSILTIYQSVEDNLDTTKESFNNRVKTLYDEWERVFGVMYGDDEDATDFTEVSSKIREMYGINDTYEIDSKRYLFSMQTFFNIFLKLLVYSFLAQLVEPMFTTQQELTKDEINRLFDGSTDASCKLVNNFFESHFLEWFTFTANISDPESSFDVKIINSTLDVVNKFDLSTFVLRPENVQDILQEVYMGLIPQEMRHLMGEYFSPDWIVEHALDMAGYTGDISKTLIDPTAGSGPFLAQAIKRIISKKGGILTKADIVSITQNIVGFDINPISVVSAKANYILIMFSAFFDNCDEEFGDSVGIPVFIADSILAPVVYTEENDETLKLETTVGEIEIPKFDSFSKGNEFLKLLSQSIDDRGSYEIFKNLALGKNLIKEKDLNIVKSLFSKLSVLHRASKDSFWPIIFRNSFAPVMIRNKFDYVVGNPPWIAWKAMSKSYRAGTLTIWKSYGIFEKNAYDKKTTHDDFGMAVTYVSVDQYLKMGGTMVFLLPASFLKSTKGGEGFRKFEIIRNNQSVPFCVDEVHDFSGVSLFTIPTVAIKFGKGNPMKYPMDRYRFYNQIGRKSKIDSHVDWKYISEIVEYSDCLAQPVDKDDIQSAWLTLEDMTFANNVVNPDIERIYKGRKGIEPAGAKGVYILLKPKKVREGYLEIVNDMSRQRRQDIIDKGVHKGVIEEKYVYPMLGGRNIARWMVKSNEYMLVPHTAEYKYGVPELILAREAPYTFQWLSFYHDELLDTRIQNGKFFNKDTQPFYRLDNVGTYTYSPYKVLWKEQTGSMSAVVVSTYLNSVPEADEGLFSVDKPIVVDSKVLMLDLYDEMEAYYVCGIINSPSVIEVVDGYAISTNRGVDVLKYIAIKKYDLQNPLQRKIAEISKNIHTKMKESFGKANIVSLEEELNAEIHKLFS
ncbi:MAG: N-6 DNA methylase [Lachnospiraceae bacterium]|nr:N-6 DNA methylase [Lachnospiraceae bacterium]